MSDIKNKVQGVDPNVRARDIKAMAEKTGNLYETISIISKRANQLNMEIKKNSILNWKNLLSVQIPLKKYMKTKSKSRFQNSTKNFLILPSSQRRNFLKVLSTIVTLTCLAVKI